MPLVVVGGLTLLAVLLRLRPFGDSLFGDELSSYYITAGHSVGRVLHILHGHSVDLNPPLYFVSTWAVEQVVGTSVGALRAVSLVCGVAAVPLTYLFALRMTSRAAAYVAAGLMAVGSYVIFYSSEARPYALVMVLVLLSGLSLLCALDDRRRRWWVAYAACSCAAIYTQFTSVFPLAALFAWALWTHREKWRSVVTANVAAALVFAPWIPALRDNLNSPGKSAIAALEPFTFHSVSTDLSHFAVGHPELPLSAVPGRVAVGLAIAGVAAAVAVAVPAIRRRRQLREEVTRLLPALLLLLAAPVAMIVYSSLTTSIWDTRNLITAWPGLAVSVGWLTTLSSVKWRSVGLALLFASFAIGAIQLQRTRTQRPNYAAAASFIAEHGQPDDPVVDGAFFTPGPLTATEVALRLGPGNAPEHPIVRVGLPPLQEVLRAPPYASLPIPSGAVIAREASRLARRGTLFFVYPGVWSDALIAAARVKSPVDSPIGGLTGQFLHALPSRFRLVRARTFPGFAPLTVYEFTSAPFA